MTAKHVAKEIEELRAELNRHNRLYYVEAAPQISDREFDRMMDRLIELEAEHPELVAPDSPTRRVGGEPITGFATVRHAVPMLSIDNTYSFDEVREWDARVRRGLNRGETVRYVVEVKVDGVAVSLRYENGTFTLGSTRGDGERGDDITANALTIRTLPRQLRTAAGVLHFISTITVFGTPTDITLSELALETFFPADDNTAQTLRQLADTLR